LFKEGNEMKNPFRALLSGIGRSLQRTDDPPDYSCQNERRSQSPISVLAITTSASNQNMIKVASLTSGWKLSMCMSVEAGLHLAEAESAHVVLLDADIPGVDWRKAFPPLLSLPGMRCVILATRVVNDNLWQTVIERGGFDIIQTPMSQGELMRIVRQGQSWIDVWTTPSRCE
jgi:DNA-binding NtrC family response regulator